MSSPSLSAQNSNTSASVHQLITDIKTRCNQAIGPNSQEDPALIKLRALLSQRIKTVIGAVAELSKDDTRSLVNFLDQVLKNWITDSQERARTLVLLSKIVAITRVLPQRLIHEHVKYDPVPKAFGGSGSVHQGIDKEICVKVMQQVDPKAFAPWVRELILWAHSSHPNLLPFTGMFFKDDGGILQICLVSPFMKSGNLSDYAPLLHQESRLPLLLDVTNGLLYLHDLGIVHSDLKGQNILITAKGRAVITDFGSSRITTNTTVTAAVSSYTVCFAAPEVAVGGERATTMSDVWSFGCLIYEVLSRKTPYYQYTRSQIIPALIRKEPPSRPGHMKVLNQTFNSLGSDDSSSDDEEQDWDLIDDKAWNIILGCCAPEPSDRLQVTAIREKIRAMMYFDPFGSLSDVLQGKNSLENLFNLQGRPTRTMVDYLYSLLLKPLPGVKLRNFQSLPLLYLLCQASGLFPRQETLNRTFKIVGTSRGSHVYRAESEGKIICLKVVSLRNKSIMSPQENLMREAILLRQLHHPNILPFYGICKFRMGAIPKIAFVYPWLRDTYSRDQVSVLVPLIYDVALGLEYLHDLGLIHGDLRRANILVNDSGKAYITGFKHAFFQPEKEATLFTDIPPDVRDGYNRWAAPELFKDGAEPTMASDIWAFGCVCYEFLSERLPFYELSGKELETSLRMGQRPKPIPVAGIYSGPGGKLWSHMDHCWAKEPGKRPTARQLVFNFRSAGLPVPERSEEQKTAEREEERFWDGVRQENEDPVDMESVERILADLRASA